MNWTKETPKADGWYWWRRDGADAKVVHVYEGDIRTTDDGTVVETVFFRFYRGEWLGPLSPDQLLNLGRV